MDAAPQTFDYKKILTSLVKKEMTVFGPDIALTKARDVSGLLIANDGTVTEIKGNPSEMTEALIVQFSQLCAPIAKKIIEPLFSEFPSMRPLLTENRGLTATDQK